MLWLQIFALLALAGKYGYHRASGKEHGRSEINMKLNSDDQYILSGFPYPYVSNSMYISSVVSYSAGPLCSGLHVAHDWVLTVASCVYRETPRDLLVITKASNSSSDYNYLRVARIIIDSFDPKTGAHNIALLQVEKPFYIVPILRLPVMGSSQTEGISQVYITRFHYHDDKKVFDAHKAPVEAKFNLNECTENYDKISPNIFYCVNLVEQIPYSYGLLDLGTPLTYTYQGNDYIMGIFTAAEYPVFNNFQKYYLYTNIWPAVEFIMSHVNHED